MEFEPHRQLRRNVIKNALKASVVGPLTSKYEVCAVRSLCVNGILKEKTWITRRLLESLLEENPYVVCFFSCITALSDYQISIGISLWIVFNWPESGFAAFKKYISKEFNCWP